MHAPGCTYSIHVYRSKSVAQLETLLQQVAATATCHDVATATPNDCTAVAHDTTVWTHNVRTCRGTSKCDKSVKIMQ
jgi:uncharacterized membrane protein